MAQKPLKNYSEEWKKVKSLSEQRLPKSALAEVNRIYTMAKKDGQDAQVIKALTWRLSLQEETRERNDSASIRDLEKEISGAKAPAKQILTSLLADIYLNYYYSHRWQLLSRSETTGLVKDDIATWSIDDFHRKIGELFLASLANERLLKATSLAPFDAIITKGNVRHLRPTLFDLLAHRALGYFMSDERDITRPAYAFEIEQESAFLPAAAFAKASITTQDSLSLQFHALKLFQQLIAFHLTDKKPDALLDADIARLQFVYNESVHPEKERLYVEALEQLTSRYGNLPAASQAWYLLAAYYEGKAASFKPYGDSTHQFSRLKAREICQRVIAQKDSSEGKINCINLLASIEESSFEFSLEKVNSPTLPFRGLVEYRNVSQLFFRIIPVNEALKKKIGPYANYEFWEAVLSVAATRSWQQPLPQTNDLQEHRVEVKIDGLPAGEYMLLASSDNNFDEEESNLGARHFYVSSISYINEGRDHFILDRETGKPLANALVQVWEQKYDYKTYKYKLEKDRQYKTDAHGFFRMKKKDEERRNFEYSLEITHNGERFFNDELTNDYFYYYDGREKEEVTTNAFLFTDRGLYRPGQTIYLKGIVIRKNEKQKQGEVAVGYTTTVRLRNANGEDVDSVEVKTNEFGSFSARFQLPGSGLNGTFTITTSDDKGYAHVQVEEYKRPKFYVEYEPVKGTYKVNDTITVTGLAKAYAGNNIGNAMVKYRVVRRARFLYPWMFWKWWLPPSPEMEITHGEMETGKDGRFTIRFAAIPDLTIDRKFEPAFDYTVYADVTDINGETRSGETSISAGFKSLVLEVAVPERISVGKFDSLHFRTENMNGNFEPAAVTVSIFELKEETRLIRPRYWERPDQFLMSKEEYIRFFPHDEYDNETDPSGWQKDAQVFQSTDSSKVSGVFSLAGAALRKGTYLVEVTTRDRNGEEIKDIKFVEVFDENDTQLNRPSYLQAEGSGPVEPGGKATVTVGTSAGDVFLIRDLDRDNTGEEEENPGYLFLRLDNAKKKLEYTITEQDRGGFGVSLVFVKHNRIYSFSETIEVPWTNKDLKIEYATYRDKTLPGSSEQWKLKITGWKNEKLAAEMLAGMYDASLDQFYPFNWQKPRVWQNYYNPGRWNGQQNFGSVDALIRSVDKTTYRNLHKEYDYLIGFRGNYLYERPFNSRGPGKMLGVDAYNMDMKLEGKVAGLQITPSADSTSIARLDTSAFEGVPAEKPAEMGEVSIRRNFNETAFFFPELRTDSTGAIEFSFTMPEALTKWKFQALTHTKDLSFGLSTKEIITQKDLMVQPNPPRFLREGDRMDFSAKIVNMTDRELTGQVELQLIDATTNQSIDGWFKNVIPNQYFTVAGGQSEPVQFSIEIPFEFGKAVLWRIVARSGNVSDGEENLLPVLTNRMLVTETLPLNMKGTGTKEFSFDKLIASANSESIQHHSLTVEYTSNPAWYAVQAIPYLMEYPYDCSEQTWNRYYANSLATMIANSSPRIRSIFEQWKNIDTAALMSNLQKNQELKAVFLEETPWVLEAKTEAEQKKNIALLFDLVKMSGELNANYEKLKQMQSSNGGFVWFADGPDNRYITQYIVGGIGHLLKLKAVAEGQENKLMELLNPAVEYLDRKIAEDLIALKKQKANLNDHVPGYATIHYLYTRSFFPELPIPKESREAVDYFTKRIRETWTKHSIYMQGMIALTLHRRADAQTAQAILRSLKERSINHEELGRYWKDVRQGWFWYEAPIERQALVIEAFSEIAGDNKTVDELKTWLLKNKQTNSWETTKATAEATYALLLQGTDWLTADPHVQIRLGNTNLSLETAQAGTGYVKEVIPQRNIKPEMGKISVTIDQPEEKETGTSWGAVYWQYFEDLDKISSAATPLSLVKKLFVETNTDRGPVLKPVNEGDLLKVGDKIKVRIELRVDRDMEFVHMKDMRASALEPVNVISSYRWQGGLGYYETTKDASTNFFFDYLRKGTYVFEYPLFITHSGSFSNGITSIQSMYAPEFAAHSEGVRIEVE